MSAKESGTPKKITVFFYGKKNKTVKCFMVKKRNTKETVIAGWKNILKEYISENKERRTEISGDKLYRSEGSPWAVVSEGIGHRV